MADSMQCTSCGYLNTAGAEVCAECGTPFGESATRLHPGETLRDPDDLSLPDSPLLRAVVRGETDAVSTLIGPPAARAAVPRPKPPVDQAAVLRDLAERLHPHPPAASTVRYAGFFLRAVAFLIDIAVLAVFAVPLTAAGYFGMRAGMVVLGRALPIDADETSLSILTAAWFAMAALYFTVLHRGYGQTIGKAALGLKVQSIDLGNVGTVRSFVRTLGYAPSSAFFGAGFLLVALTPRKRAWHDFLAGTCVVRLARDEA